jgi:redox-sensitive bicupin YhaK (pirin superfamily)
VPVTVEALAPTRIMLLGGAKLTGDRQVWWNFVSSSKERIERAKDDWKNRSFPIIAGDDIDFIPLPSV